MKAITMRQPWAGMVACRLKTIETRTWRTKHRGLIAIHSSQRVDCHWPTIEAYGYDVPEHLRMGGCVLAVADLVRCHRLRGCETAQTLCECTDKIGWWLERIVALPEPVPCTGARGVWELPADVHDRINAVLSTLAVALWQELEHVG